MNYKSFIKTQEWIDLKGFFKDEIIDRPLDIKTDFSTERIALEVRASQLATAKVLKAIRKFERLAGKELVEQKPYI